MEGPCLDLEKASYTQENRVPGPSIDTDTSAESFQLAPILRDPFETLPIDIIIEIVRLLDYPNRKQHIALNLSHVSKLWRAIVHSIPTLWNDITVDLSTSLDYLAACLALSADCHLNVKCIFQKPPPFDSDADRYLAGEILNLIVQHSTRWRRFLFRSSDHRVLEKLLSCLEVIDTPQLEFLGLVDHKTWENRQPGDFRHFSLPIPCPKLTTLELRVLSNLSRITPIHLKALVLSSPNLANLTIHGMAIDLSQSDAHESISIPSLRFLAIGQFPSDGVYMGSLFNLLSVPSVEILQLWGHGSRPETTAIVQTIGPQSFPSLRSLSLFHIELYDDFPPWIARTFPDLTDIAFIERRLSFVHQFLRWLANNPERASEPREPLPFLRRIKFPLADPLLLTKAVSARPRISRICVSKPFLAPQSRRLPTTDVVERLQFEGFDSLDATDEYRDQIYEPESFSGI